MNNLGVGWRLRATLYRTASSHPFREAREIPDTSHPNNRHKRLSLAMDLLPSPLRPSTDSLCAAFRQQLTQHRYSGHSIRTYLAAMRRFLVHIAPRLPQDLTRQEVSAYLATELAAKGASVSYQNMVARALQLYCLLVLQQPDTACLLPHAQRTERLPRVLRRAEVAHMIACAGCSRHAAMLMLLYGAGLRAGELLALRVGDLDFGRALVYVRGQARKAGRQVPMPRAAMPLLAALVAGAGGDAFVFGGRVHGHPYSGRSLELVVKSAARRAGLGTDVTAHSLRHSFAAHLVEAGVDLHIVQDLLGHASLRQTALYQHVARHLQPASPLDSLRV